MFEIAVAPVINGGDPLGINHVCGSCGICLLEHIGPAAQFFNVVIKCPGCGKYNTP